METNIPKFIQFKISFISKGIDRYYILIAEKCENKQDDVEFYRTELILEDEIFDDILSLIDITCSNVIDTVSSIDEIILHKTYLNTDKNKVCIDISKALYTFPNERSRYLLTIDFKNTNNFIVLNIKRNSTTN